MKQTLPRLTRVLVGFALFIDAAVSVSGGPLLIVQSKHIQFPSGLYFLLYQFIFIFCHFTSSTGVAWFSAVTNPIVSLAVALLLCSFALYLQYLSYVSGSLLLFFLSRAVNGIFRHDKFLLGKMSTSYEEMGVLLVKTAQYGAYAGLLAGGVLGDVVTDGPTIVYLILMAEFAAFSGLLLAMVVNPVAPSAPTPPDSPKYVTFVKDTFMNRKEQRNNLILLFFVVFSAAVHQCSYPVLPHRYGLTNTFTGAHLIVSSVMQTILPGHLLGNFPTSLLSLRNALLLLTGGYALDAWMQQRGPWYFYPFALVTIDLPVGIAIHFLSRRVREEDKESSKEAATARLLRHTVMAAKFFGAPMRILCTEQLGTSPYVVLLCSLPCVLYVLQRVSGVGEKVAATVAVVVTSLLLGQVFQPFH